MNAFSRLPLRAKTVFCFIGVLCFGFAAAPALERLAGEPRIELTFSRYETNQNARFAIIRIRNVGNAPAIYRGYSTNDPDCNLECRTASGAWSGRIRRCIVPGDQTLPPGCEIRARQYLPDEENWRIGFYYRKTRLQDHLSSPFRSMLPYLRPKFQRVWTPEMKGDVCNAPLTYDE
jgi:hypothetical protein